MGKNNGQKLFRQRKYLLWTLNEVLDTANKCSVTNESDDTSVSVFERKLSFRQLYDFIKLNKEYVYNRNIPHATCFCEIWGNTILKDLNNWLWQISQLLTNPLDIAEKFSCYSAFEECMNLKYHECESSQADKIVSQVTDKRKYKVVLYEWKKVDERVQTIGLI